MKHSLSELQDYLDSGQLDEGNPDPTALAELLAAAPDLIKITRAALTGDWQLALTAADRSFAP